MDELIKKAIEALQKSSCNEIELTDEKGQKVRVVKFTPIPMYAVAQPYQFTPQY